jgi:peptide-methionine (S)-S-oxide reductase
MMQIVKKTVLILASWFAVAGCQAASVQDSNNEINMEKAVQEEGMEIAVLGAGCFWCVEAVFESLKGVISVESGYTGGNIKNPSYKEVCTGRTGHAEVTRIVFDPKIISFSEILEVFWQTHDPTTLNRQGADVGTQYRSAIFYTSDAQRNIAMILKGELDASGAWSNPIVTEISAMEVFYPAEDYHQDYYRNNTDQPYCSAVIRPKMEKFKKVFSDKLK